MPSMFVPIPLPALFVVGLGLTVGFCPGFGFMVAGRPGCGCVTAPGCADDVVRIARVPIVSNFVFIVANFFTLNNRQFLPRRAQSGLYPKPLRAEFPVHRSATKLGCCPQLLKVIAALGCQKKERI